MTTPGWRRLRVLVCPHELVTGGSQLIAIALATALQERGHVVEVYAPDGPLADAVRRRGLALRTAAAPGGRRIAAVRGMRREIERFRPDIVHTFESEPAVAAAAASLARPHHAVASVLSMAVPDYIPAYAPLLVGTAELAALAGGRRGDVHLLEPPVDVVADAPGDQGAARRRLAIADEAFVVAVVGRLSGEHEKARGVAAAIDVLAADPALAPTTLVIAGDGDEAGRVDAAISRARAASSRLVVRREGELSDPRDVYDAADVVFGMGSSALRALAHAKAVIVQGSGGFWRAVTPQTAPGFLTTGFFGHGGADAGDGDGFAQVLAGFRDPEVRAVLGDYGRELVCRRYSLEGAATRVERIYLAELERRRPRARGAAQALAAVGRYARYRAALRAPGLQQAWRTVTGRVA